MIEVILHALHSGIKVFIFIFLIYIVLSFFEEKIINRFKKSRKYTSLFGSLVGLVPQCGISVIAGDLYLKRHITMGTLVAVFLACSDEAVVILLGNKDTALSVILLLVLKFIIGFVVGFVVDLFVSKKTVTDHIIECPECDVSDVKCCCNHCTCEDEENTKFDIYVWHPFIHSLKLVGIVFVFNVIFGTLIYLIGENNIIQFLEFNKYITPLVATLVGLIPNCASSVILSELYIANAISFGSLLAGLLVNAGLGLLMILKNKNIIKESIIILAVLVITAVVCGYLTCFILGF